MIYVLTSGEYSDYHIDAVTSNKKIAEAYAKIYKCEIEEYKDLQDMELIRYADKLVTAFYFEFDKRGNIIDQSQEFVTQEIDIGDGYLSYENFRIGVKANDEETAKKIAYDKRAKFLAEYYHIT